MVERELVIKAYGLGIVMASKPYQSCLGPQALLSHVPGVVSRLGDGGNRLVVRAKDLAVVHLVCIKHLGTHELNTLLTAFRGSEVFLVFQWILLTFRKLRLFLPKRALLLAFTSRPPHPQLLLTLLA